MKSLFIGVFRSSKGGIEFDVSHFSEKHQALAGWEESGFEILDVIEVELRVDTGYTAPAVVRALASTPDGADILATMLRAVADHQRSWEIPLQVAVSGE